MKHYSVILSDEAAQDMEDIHSYIKYNLFSPQSAEGQYKRIAKAIQRLDTFPQRFPVAVSKPDFPEELRKMVVDHYIVLYFIRGDSVMVLDVFYGASDLEHKLEKLKSRF